MKKFHSHHMLSFSLSLSLSLSLLADADPESFDSDNVFFYICIYLMSFLLMRGERIQIPKKRAVIGPPAKLHLMAFVALESISVKIV